MLSCVFHFLFCLFFQITLTNIVPPNLLFQASHTLDLLPFKLCNCLQFNSHYPLASN
jgi:hypothetical protein